MAATVGLSLLGKQEAGNGLYVPLSIESIRLFAPLPATFTAQVNIVAEKPGRFVTFDGQFAAGDGAVLASFNGFCLRWVQSVKPDHSGGATAATHATLPQRLLMLGIRGAEAPELFDRILTGGERQVVVSSVSLPELRSTMRRPKVAPRPTRKASVGANEPARMNPVERKIGEFWSELFGVSNVGLQDDFFALGGHSLSAVRLVAKLRKEFGVELALAAFFETPTLQALAAKVAALAGIDTASASDEPASETASAESRPAVAGSPAPWSPLVPIVRGEPGRRPLFCVHGGGGNVLNFKALADRLKGHPFFGLQARGVDGRQAPMERIEDMAAAYIDAARSADPQGPYCLIGYSGGGVIAFEMAQQLIRAGDKVALLIMLDTLAPTAASRPIPLSAKLWNARHHPLQYVFGWPRRSREVKIARQKEQEALGYVARGERLPDGLLEIRLMSAYMAAQNKYNPVSYPGKLTILTAGEADLRYRRAGPYLGWEGLALGGTDVHSVAGSHFSMMSPPGVDEIAAIILKEVARSEEGGSR
jgi:thioesterase domain-containing protein/acyl carrier protein